jgi:hypothetical protein
MLMRFKITVLLLSGIIFLVAGGIYIFFREENLLMNEWFAALNLDNSITLIRESFFFRKISLNNLILYSFPDGAWVLFGSMLLLHIWDFKFNLWSAFFPLIGIGSEILQNFGILSGTYDHSDLAFLIVASIIPLYLSYIISRNSITINIKTKQNT